LGANLMCNSAVTLEFHVEAGCMFLTVKEFICHNSLGIYMKIAAGMLISFIYHFFPAANGNLCRR
jgi:hypothetical protein